MKRGLIVFLLIVILSGCVGKPAPSPSPPPGTTQPPIATTPAPITTQPPATSPPPIAQQTTAPPPTTPTATPASKYSLQTTSTSEVIPDGSIKAETLTTTDYDALQFPIKIGTMVEGVKAVYKTPTGNIYALKYDSVDLAGDFFNAILEKAVWRGTPYVEKTLIMGGKSLKVYHRIEFTKYLGTLVRRGLFIYYVTISADEFTAEQYIKTNMLYLFDGEPEPRPIPLATKSLEFTSAGTPITDVVPEGAKIEAIPNTDYQYTIKYPNKPAGYVEDIRATYTIPDGNIYVSKFQITSGAEAFLVSVIDKYSRAGSAPVKKTLTRDGKSLDVYHKIEAGAYQGTLIQRGVFLFYVSLSKDDFDAEFYISRKLGFLFQ